MAVKINTSYGELLKSDSLNEKIHNIIGSNAILSGFDVVLSAKNTIQVKPGKAFIQGCAIEETSDTKTVTIAEELLSNAKLYAKINYNHRLKTIDYVVSATEAALNEVELAELVVVDGVVTEVKKHSLINTVNSVVGAAADLEAQKIRDMIPSGFVKLGELDYDYMLNNENVVKLKTDSVAYVNGYRIEIPAGTIINIGKAPEKDAREDLLFLEAWKDQDFNRDGKLKWRIRHVANIDFSKVWIQANDGADKYIGINSNGSEYSLIIPQGGLTEPYKNHSWSNVFQNRSKSPYLTDNLMNKTNGDSGLWCNMVYSYEIELNKKRFNTIDGFVYAIPMFKLYRRPSCGKAISFEYQKINPKVNYSKFADLMKEEKAERVVSENISGRSTMNLIKAVGVHSNFHTNVTTTNTSYSSSDNSIHTKISAVSATPTFCMLGLDIKDISDILIKDEVYTIAYFSYGDIHPDGVAYTRQDSKNTIFSVQPTGIGGYGFKKIAFTITNDITVATGRKIYFWFNGNNIKAGQSLDIKNVMLIKGDWTNKPIPGFFTELKSLGEDEGNLIEVKNGILNESSYNPSTGNAKLTTVSGANYITSDNNIMPNIEAQIKRGDSKLSDLTNFGGIDNLVGDEKIEFTKIKGRTIQNLIQSTSNNTTIYYDICRSSLIKPNTTYTILFTNPSSSTVSVYLNETIFVNGGTPKDYGLGTHKLVFTTKDTISDTVILKNGKSNPNTVTNCMLLEGDLNDVPVQNIPYLEYIKSVGENENNKIILRKNGKNVFDGDKYLAPGIRNSQTIIGLKFTRTDKSSFLVEGTPTGDNFTLHFPQLTKELIEGKRYVLSGEYLNMCLRRIDGKTDWIRDFVYSSSVYKSAEVYMQLPIGSIGKYYKQQVNVMLREYDLSSDYEPYKEYKQEITLKEPLRSLPNGVCDYIEGNKVIRRVGKMILNGTENWQNLSGTQNNDTTYFAQYSNVFNMKGISNYAVGGYCDTLTFLGATEVYNVATTTSCIGINAQGVVQIRQLKSQLPSIDIQGLKTWLSQNPTTIYYELANPTEELIEPNYDKESIKTYQLDQPLRSLPNGVKDEIVDGKLIRRCGEIIFKGDSNEPWISLESNVSWSDSNILAFDLKGLNNIKTGSYFIHQSVIRSSYYAVTGVSVKDSSYIATWSAGPTIVLGVERLKLSSQDVLGLKQWLNSNPVKLIYELANPIEIPLKEVHSNTSNFSLQRQFSDGNWLRELPSGVKDTVENGKVIRRVGKYTFTGNEGWLAGGQVGAMYVEANLTNLKAEASILTNTLPKVNLGANLSANPIGIMATLTPSIRIKYSSADCTAEGFKTWLAQNPTTILYELKTPTEEALSTDNYTYYPCHEINTYCGSLYLGNGTVDTFVNNGLKNDGVIINTPFRSIENKAIVTDCKYKKNVDGYDTYDIVGKSNLFNKNTCLSDKTIDSTNGTITGMTNRQCSDFIPVRKNINYYINTFQNAILYDRNKKYVKLLAMSTDTKIVNSNIDGYIKLTFISNATNLDTVQMIEGIIDSEYELYIPTLKYFENTESNDIEDLRHQVSLTGFNYEQVLNESFDKLLRGEL